MVSACESLLTLPLVCVIDGLLKWAEFSLSLYSHQWQCDVEVFSVHSRPLSFGRPCDLLLPREWTICDYVLILVCDSGTLHTLFALLKPSYWHMDMPGQAYGRRRDHIEQRWNGLQGTPWTTTPPTMPTVDHKCIPTKVRRTTWLLQHPKLNKCCLGWSVTQKMLINTACKPITPCA